MKLRLFCLIMFVFYCFSSSVFAEITKGEIDEILKNYKEYDGDDLSFDCYWFDEKRHNVQDVEHIIDVLEENDLTDKITIVDLAWVNVLSIPRNIKKLKNIKELCLDNKNFDNNENFKWFIGITGLKKISLQKNKLDFIPDFIFSQKDLEELDLKENIIHEIPPEIGALFHLKELDLTKNKLEEINWGYLSNLRELKKLFLGDNQLRKITIKNELDQLVELVLEGNKITDFNINENSFQSLETLSLSRNLFSAFPENLNYLKNLKNLKYSRNNLRKIPPKGELPLQITSLDLSNNKIEEIHNLINEFTNLENLNLQNNNINFVSPSIGWLEKLSDLNLSNNKINVLPETISFLIRLKNLYLGNNNLITFPREVLKLKNLTSLNLSNNAIHKVPKEISDLSSLSRFVMNGCQLTELPDSMALLTNLWTLDLRNNEIQTMKNILDHLTSLRFLYLSNNKIEIFPESALLLPKVFRIDLSNNKIKKIPEHLNCVLKDTAKVDLLDNPLEKYLSIYSGSWSFSLLDLQQIDRSTYFRQKDAFNNSNIFFVTNNYVEKENRCFAKGYLAQKSIIEKKVSFDQYEATTQMIYKIKNLQNDIRRTKVVLPIKKDDTVVNGDFWPLEYLEFIKKSCNTDHMPVLIYTHGDGPNNTMKLDRNDALFYFYLSKCWKVVAVNFRGHDPSQDVYDVIKYLRSNDKEIDLGNIVLTGISRGSYYNFKLLVKKKEKIDSLLKGVILFSTVNEPSFVDYSKLISKNIPILFIHGMKDDVADVKTIDNVYTEMKRNGHNVRIYFSKSGNHHMVTEDLTEKTSTRSGEYKDFVGWIKAYTEFTTHLLKGDLKKRNDDQRNVDLKKSLFLVKEKLLNEKLGIDKKKMNDWRYDESSFLFSGTIPSIKFMRVFNRDYEGDHLYNKNDLFTLVENFYENNDDNILKLMIKDTTLKNKILKLLFKEQKYLEKYPSKIVAYHAVTSPIFALYIFLNIWNKVLNFSKSSSPFDFDVFREFNKGRCYLYCENSFGSLKEEFLNVKLPNIEERYASNTISFATTLFSGYVNSSSPLFIWGQNQAATKTPLNIYPIILKKLSSVAIPLKRKQAYIDLIKDYLDNQKGTTALFQFFFDKNILDQYGDLVSTYGKKLEFSFSGASSFNEDLIHDPKSLVEKFSQDKGFYDDFNVPLFMNGANKDRYFATAQYRLLAHPEVTTSPGIKIFYYPYKNRVFNQFYQKLAEMIKKDALIFNPEYVRSRQVSETQEATYDPMTDLDAIVRKVGTFL